MSQSSNPLRREVAALRTALHLTEAAAIMGATVAPVWTIEGDTAVGRFEGRHALVHLNAWRNAVPHATLSFTRTADGIEWTVSITHGDAVVQLLASAPFTASLLTRTAVNA